jgi:hypothetical protein
VVGDDDGSDADSDSDSDTDSDTDSDSDSDTDSDSDSDSDSDTDSDSDSDTDSDTDSDSDSDTDSDSDVDSDADGDCSGSPDVSQTVNEDGLGGLIPTLYLAQSFVPSVSTITGIELMLDESAVDFGPLTVQLRANGSGAPASSALASASVDVVLGTTGVYEEYCAALGSVSVSAGSTYWIVLIPNASVADPDTTYWALQYSTDPYAAGYNMYSEDSGATWLDLAGAGYGGDFCFAVYGS